MLGSGMVLCGIPAVFIASGKSEAGSTDRTWGMAARILTVLAIVVFVLNLFVPLW